MSVRDDRLAAVREYAENLGLLASFTKHGDLLIKMPFTNPYWESDFNDIWERAYRTAQIDELERIIKRLRF